MFFVALQKQKKQKSDVWYFLKNYIFQIKEKYFIIYFSESKLIFDTFKKLCKQAEYRIYHYYFSDLFEGAR